MGIMIAVGVPTGILSLIFAGVLWSKYIGGKIHTDLPSNIQDSETTDDANLPGFPTVLAIVFVPLILILCSTVSEYIPALEPIRPVLLCLGTPFVALIIAVLLALFFLGKKQGYNDDQLKTILDHSLPSNRSDPVGHHWRRHHPLGTSRLRYGKYYRTCISRKAVSLSFLSFFSLQL